MRRGPPIDGRDADALYDRARKLAESYTETWTPDDGDAGEALLWLFAGLAADVTERADRVPEKHRVAFFDRLGFTREPAQSAWVPLQFTVADGLSRNVRIPAETTALAPATDDRPEQRFQVPPDGGFEATPAAIASLYGVDGRYDRIVDHESLAVADAETGLFQGANVQEHALALADDEQFELTPKGLIEVSLRTNVPGDALSTDLVWQYYGTRGDGDPGWYHLQRAADSADQPEPSPSDDPIDRLTDAELAFVERVHERLGHQAFEVDPTVTPSMRRGILERVLTVFYERRYRRFHPDSRDPSRLSQVLAGAAVPESTLGPETERALEQLLREVPPVEPVAVGGTGTVEDTGRDEATTELRLRLPADGEITDHEVAGIESRWIRCVPRSAFGMSLASVGLGTSAAALDPDAMLFNDVPVTPDSTGRLYPLGDDPQRLSAFAISSDEAFSTVGADVTVEFRGGTAASDITARLSWEYWNGERWADLPARFTEPSVRNLSGPGDVVFTVPHDFEPRSVAGETAHWIRARLEAGDYGKRTPREAPPGSSEGTRYIEVGQVTPPSFTDITIRYETPSDATPQHVVRENNLDAEPVDLDADGGSVRPFVPVPDRAQALYAGFDGQLRDGPVPLYVDAKDQGYSREFNPRVRWEYCVDPETDTWESLAVRDETDGFRKSGVVWLGFPEDTTAFERFGADRHWIRARVSGSTFDEPASLFRVRTGDDGPTGGRIGGPCRRYRVRGTGASEQMDLPPLLSGIYPNTGWANNARTVDDEVLGGSDGTASQEFTVANPPVREATVWVDERRSLTADQRAELLEARPDDVDVRRGPDEGIRAVWVRWDPVDDFLDSSGTDRQYSLDAATGRLQFGDGNSGMIPPEGAENIRVSYRTGGGRAGNVANGAITELVSSVAFVDAVENVVPADGGADTSTTDEVLATAPETIRDRGKAVTAPDFERITEAAARAVARAKCIPGLDERGDRTRGWVTVLVVPQSGERRPTPSPTLTDRLTEALSERAPAALVDCDHLVVRGPSYVTVTIDTTLVGDGTETLGTVEDVAAERVGEYLHPLTGGEGGAGWDFGELPCRSDFFALLERIDGVDHVAALTVELEGIDGRIRLTEGTDRPDVAPDVLVASGTHRVRATGEP